MSVLGLSVQEETGGVTRMGGSMEELGICNTEMREAVFLKDFIYSIIIAKDRTIQ